MVKYESSRVTRNTRRVLIYIATVLTAVIAGPVLLKIRTFY